MANFKSGLFSAMTCEHLVEMATSWCKHLDEDQNHKRIYGKVVHSTILVHLLFFIHDYHQQAKQGSLDHFSAKVKKELG